MKRFERLKIRREEAAKYIQRVWKRHRMISMIPKAWRRFKNGKILIIQKFLRGYVVRKKVVKNMMKHKLKSNLDYFGKIKDWLWI